MPQTLEELEAEKARRAKLRALQAEKARRAQLVTTQETAPQASEPRGFGGRLRQEFKDQFGRLQNVADTALQVGGVLNRRPSPARPASLISSALFSDDPRARLRRQGATGGFSDEIVGVFAGDEAEDQARAAADAFRQSNPGQALANEALGTAATLAAGGALTQIPRLAQAANLFSRLPQTARIAAQSGAIGAAFGAGTAQPGERAKAARRGGAIGLIAGPAANKALNFTGGALDMVSAPIRRQVNNMVDKHARRVNQLVKNAPSIQQLRNQVNDVFRRAERQGVTATERQTAILQKSIDGMLRREQILRPNGQLLPEFTKVERARALISDFSGKTMTPRQMQNIRRTIQSAAQSNDDVERRIGTIMLKRFDSFIDDKAPVFREARGLFQRQKKAELIDEAVELAGARAGQFTGSGFENALRTEFRKLDRQLVKGKLRGFSEAEKEAVKAVARGGPAANIARAAGRFAPTGVVSAGISGGVPFLVGKAATGSTAGGFLASGLTMAIGIGGRSLATRLGMNAANTASALMRAGVAPQALQRLSIPQKEALALLISAQMASQDSGKEANE